MKIKVELEKGETLQQAEESLEKAVKAKIKSRAKQDKNEKYVDEAVEDYHRIVVEHHQKLVNKVIKDIKGTLEKL